MAISTEKKERIARDVIQEIYRHYQISANVMVNNPFARAFASINERAINQQDNARQNCAYNLMHGLNTSLGQSFFEGVAHILCDGEKRDFKSNEIYINQMSAISDIMIDLKNGTETPSVNREDEILANQATGDKQTASNFTADCFYETENEVVALELKSVRPNSGEMRGEKQKVLIGKAVLRGLYPQKNVRYIFGFPFDPTSDSDVGYDKQRFLHYLVEAEKFIAHEDFLIADELWSFLASSNNVMQEILEIINRIATPRFMDKFDALQNKKTSREEKRNILEEWYLFSEVTILENVRQNASNSRIYNQSIFKNDGSYNTNRLTLLNLQPQ